MIQRVHAHICSRATRYCGIVFIILAFILTEILASCGGSQPTTTATPATTPPTPTTVSIPSIMIMAMEFKFTIPATIQSGLLQVTFMNDGKEPHELSFLRINDGVTVDQFKAALLKFPPTSFAMIKWHGGIGTIMPGTSAKVIVNLDPGQYVAVCFVNSPPNAVPHFVEGMFQPFTVMQNSSQAQPSPPIADAEATIHNFSYTLPTIHAGPMMLKVTNNDPIAHEMNLFKLNAGKTIQDARAFVKGSKGPPPLNTAQTGPAPYTYVGGSQPLESGLSDWLELDLTPGNYVALCFVPDPNTGMSHVDMGMIVAFTVA